jgi:hypothetical protein
VLFAGGVGLLEVAGGAGLLEVAGGAGPLEVAGGAGLMEVADVGAGVDPQAAATKATAAAREADARR